MRHHASDHNSRPLGPAILLALALLVATAIAPLRAQQSNPALPPAASQTTFIENRGQWDPSAQFLVQTPGLDAWITAGGVVYDVYRHESDGDQKGNNRTLAERFGYDDPFARAPSHGEFASKPEVRNRIGHVVQMKFEGSKPKARLVGTDQQPGVYNYFLGSDRSKWASKVRRYSGVRVENLYDGIDAVYYLDEGRPRYDLVVAPGGNPGQIEMRFEGAQGVHVSHDGALEIATTMGPIRQQELFAYQEIDGMRQQVRCAFVANPNGVVAFEVGEYDRSRELVVDPLVWSTLLGGSNYDWGWWGGAAVDGMGNVYVTGKTNSTDFPTTDGAYEGSLTGNDDVFVTKLSSDGVSLKYSTYIGGTKLDQPHDITVDGNASAYVIGYTYSRDYPVTGGVLGGSHNGGSTDVFVTKLSSDGTSLEYSTYIGGSSDDLAYGIAVDGSANAYVTGRTYSTNYPVTVGAFDNARNGYADAFVTKLSPDAASLDYSTYIGGSNYEIGTGIKVDGSANAYIVGYTGSSDYPTTSGAYNESNNGGNDVFVTKLSSDGATLGYSTYIGGSGDDTGVDIAVDHVGRAYVAGDTYSSDYPTSSGAYDTSYDIGRDLFVTALSSDGATLTFSTYIGGSSDEYMYGIALDGSGNSYITGYTRGLNYPTTSGAYDDSHNGGSDAFVTRLNSDGASLGYSTYFGGSATEYGLGIAYDNGNAFIVGYTTSTNFPVTSGSYDGSLDGIVDVFIAKLLVAGTITLTSPNGAQSWCAGTSQILTWTSTAVTDVRIELSDDAGSTWSEIVASTPAAGGSYSWAIPATQAGGSSYRVRVSDASASAVNDASDADFTINAAPAITAQPTDQVVVAGSSATFTVATSATATVQWQSSTDGGTSWGDLSGATSTTYSLTAAIAGSGTQYRAVFDNGTCTSTTDPATLTVKVSATDLGPAVIFLGVTDNGDNNSALDLKVDLYRNGVLISSGELTDERVTGTLLNSSRKYTVPLTMTGSSVDFSATDVLSVVVSARRNGGDDDFDAVLWYDASTSQSINHGNKGWSRVGNETEGGTSTGYYYLRGSSALNGSSGTSGTTVQRSLGTTWVEFGTWSMYGAQMKSVTDGPAVAGTLSAVLIPNPSDGDIVTLRLSQGPDQEVSISVVDATGRIIMAERIENARSQADAGIPINTRDLSSGTYLVIVRSGEESIVRRLTIVR